MGGVVGGLERGVSDISLRESGLDEDVEMRDARSADQTEAEHVESTGVDDFHCAEWKWFDHESTEYFEQQLAWFVSWDFPKRCKISIDFVLPARIMEHMERMLH